MSMFNSFEELDNLSTDSVKPFFAIDLSNESDVINWLMREKEKLKTEKYSYLEKYKNNLLRYKGYQYFNAIYTPRDILESQKKYTPQVVMPFISDAIDEKTARIVESKPSVAILPQHNETQDKQDTQTAKKFIQHLDYTQHLDKKFTQVLKNAYIAGESFLWIRWNPDAGEIMPESQAMIDQGIDAPFVTIGDVEAIKKTSPYVFYETREQWDQVNYCFIDEWEYTEALRREYPDKASDIVEELDGRLFDYDKMEEIRLQGMTKKTYFYHKKTKFLPQGFEAIFAGRVLLKAGPLSYKHGSLPIERLVDIQNDEELRGQSSIDKVRGIASNVNNMFNMVIKQIMLAGYAKWFVQAGSVDDQSLNNDISIVKIKAGSNAPVLAQANPVGAGVINIMDKFISYFDRFAKSSSVVRGEPPPGVTASVALQFLSESEARRINTEIQQFNQFVRSVYDKLLKTAGQFYKPEDQRTMLIMGTDNKWNQIPLNTKSLGKNYSVVIQNTSGLADSKALRTQQLIDLNASFPELLPREQVLEMTGFAMADQFQSVSTAAAKAAQDENELMSNGIQYVEPAEHEDSITHWQIHVQEMQPIGFKEKASPVVQQWFKDHVMATEYLIMEMAQTNPLVAERVAQLKGFPIFMESPLPPAFETVEKKFETNVEQTELDRAADIEDQAIAQQELVQADINQLPQE